MQKDSAQAKISLKVVGGLLFLTHPVQCQFVEDLAMGLFHVDQANRNKATDGNGRLIV